MKCQHHWVIEMPNGQTSPGTCKKCGAFRDDFKNYLDDLWTFDNLGRQWNERNPLARDKELAW